MNKTICNKRVKRLSLMFAKSAKVRNLRSIKRYFWGGSVSFGWKRKKERVIAGYKIRNNVIRPPFQPSLVYE